MSNDPLPTELKLNSRDLSKLELFFFDGPRHDCQSSNNAKPFAQKEEALGATSQFLQ